MIPASTLNDLKLSENSYHDFEILMNSKWVKSLINFQRPIKIFIQNSRKTILWGQQVPPQISKNQVDTIIGSLHLVIWR